MNKDELINLIESNDFIVLYTKINYLIGNDQFEMVTNLDMILKHLSLVNKDYIQLEEYTIVFDKVTDEVVDLYYQNKDNNRVYHIPKGAYLILNNRSYLPLKQIMIAHDLVLKIDEFKEQYPESDPYDIFFKDHYIFIEDLWVNGYFYRMVKYDILDEESIVSYNTVYFTDTKKYKDYINQQLKSSDTYWVIAKLLDTLSDKKAKEDKTPCHC